MRLLLVFMSAAYAATPPVQRTAAPPDDKQRIAAVVSEFQSAWNTHDATRFAMLFAEDAEFIRNDLQGQPPDDRADQHPSPSGGRSVVDAWWEMTGARTPQGDPRPLRKGQMHLVMTKDGDAWTILVMHNLELSPP